MEQPESAAVAAFDALSTLLGRTLLECMEADSAAAAGGGDTSCRMLALSLTHLPPRWVLRGAVWCGVVRCLVWCMVW